MKPIKLQRMKRTNFYTPARRVWFQKNDDRLEDKCMWKKVYEGKGTTFNDANPPKCKECKGYETTPPSCKTYIKGEKEYEK